MLMAGYFENDHTRYAIGHRVTGDYRTTAFGGAIELGFKHYISQVSVNPFVAVQYDRLRQHEYAEDDQLWGNHYQGENLDSLPVSAGVRIAGSVVNGFGLIVKPSLKYSYINETRRERGITVSPIPALDYRARINGVSAPDHIQQLEFGLKAQLPPRGDFHVNVIKEWASGSHSSIGSLGVNYFF